jgi:UDP-N-acetylmuramate dehydrogenase
VAIAEHAALGALERALSPALRCERDVPASTLTTWRVGGPIALVAHCASVADVEAVGRALDPALGVLTVGRGSNLLLADAGFPGVGIVLEDQLEELRLPAAGPEPSAGAEVVAGGAVALPVLARQAAAAGWRGLEFFVGIPGSVGGAVRMNAGGHGRETVEVLRRAQVVRLDGTSATWHDVGTLDLSYRHSAIGSREVVVGAAFAVEADDPGECGARVDEIVRWRRAHQPGGANAGSVFSNPPGDSAGRLIDAAGLKGARVGGASVSEKHANFIQTEPGATADDVRTLIELVRRRVAHANGTDLTPEVRIVGFDHPQASVEGTRP